MTIKIQCRTNTDEMFRTLHKQESVYQDMTTSRNAKPVPSTSPWEDDSQARQNEASVGVDEL